MPRNRKETLTQNYRRLGLVARLKAPTGGVEKLLSSVTDNVAPPHPDFFPISKPQSAVHEARVERAADGSILRVIDNRKPNPLNDLLNDIESDSDAEDAAEPEHEEWGGIDDEIDESRPRVIQMLEKEARRPVEKRTRHTSDQEALWLSTLVEKHGNDTKAMARDLKLNTMQQTAADIAKRIKRWKAEK